MSHDEAVQLRKGPGFIKTPVSKDPAFADTVIEDRNESDLSGMTREQRNVAEGILNENDPERNLSRVKEEAPRRGYRASSFENRGPATVPGDLKDKVATKYIPPNLRSDSSYATTNAKERASLRNGPPVTPTKKSLEKNIWRIIYASSFNIPRICSRSSGVSLCP